jgi:hypothetical protein
MRLKILPQLIVLCLGLVTVWGCKKNDATPLPQDVQGDVCAHNLQVLAQGKKVWAENGHKGADDTPTMQDLVAFIRHTPSCPSGGTYTLGKVSEAPTCSIAAHNDAYKKLTANP